MAGNTQRANVLLAWLGGGIGVILIYAAYKNVGPVSIITGRLSGDTSRTVIDPSASMGAGAGATSTDTGSGSTLDKGATTPASSNTLQRAQALASREIQPTLIPLLSQPWITLDTIAAASFLKVQFDYGHPITLTGGYRSVAEQARQHALHPDRFVEPGHSLHEVGLAVDINTTTNDVNDARLIQAFQENGWYRVGKSGPMHWSYGVPG